MNHLSYTALFLLLKQSIYHGTGYIDRLTDWHSKDDRKMLSSYSISLIHTLICLALPIYNLYYNNNNFIDNYSYYDIQLHHISMAYYVVDLFYAIVEKQKEFIIHHSLTMFIEEYYYYNNMPLLLNLSLLIGETTNPYLILWTLSKHKKYDLFGKINGFTTYSYAFVRLLCIPVLTAVSYYKICKNQEVSILNKAVIGGFSFIFNCGGIYWARGLLRGYKKWKKKQT